MDLSDWRNEIDAIDAEVLRLLVRRAEIVAEIGKRKAIAKMPVIDEDRERQILSRISLDADSVLSTESAHCVFRCIIEESRRIQAEIVSSSKFQVSS